MRETTIEYIAYQIDEAKKSHQNMPIVFLGAGASTTGNIPAVSKIIEDILTNYEDNPNIKALKIDDRNYSNLMNCLTPLERNELLKGYIDNAKVNVTHLYLAQLIKEGFVDYVLTVNFDNLMLRALALYNIFPPTYDMAILKDLTTTTFEKKSVVYLHGQHHGLWLLNTQEEMTKVKNVIPPILNKLSDKRPWIFIGYSGNDPIFNQIVKLGRFDNGLFWVTFNENIPCDNVCNELLNKDNSNAFIVKGYDADSFMIKLSNSLGLEQPEVISTPFSMLSNLLDNIVDIDDKEHFKLVKERLQIQKKHVEKAKELFENGNFAISTNIINEAENDNLKKLLLEMIVKGEYNESVISSIEEKIGNTTSIEDKSIFQSLYFNWGNHLFDLARLNSDESLFSQSIDKFEKAFTLDPEDSDTFFNWGSALCSLAKLKKDANLFIESIEKLEKASNLNPENHYIYYNWGICLYNLSRLVDKEPFLLQSLEKYEKASIIAPDDFSVMNNWGIALYKLAQINKDEALYQKSLGLLMKVYEDLNMCYNIACLYATKNEKENALKYLDICLSKFEVTAEHVKNDEDWDNFRNDKDFIDLLEKHQ